jgi:hypothetical protein
VPDGAREATARIASMSTLATGLDRNARIDRRDVIASSTTTWDADSVELIDTWNGGDVGATAAMLAHARIIISVA